MRKLFSLLGLLMVFNSGLAQKYILKEGVITFFSEAALENIMARNTSVRSLFEITSNKIAFSVPINQFEFEKKLMQQHFNEKYMESDKFPRSTFEGKLENFQMSTMGEQKVKAVGKLTIHGVTQFVAIPGKVEAKQGAILMNSVFKIKLADYKIKIPQLLWQNVAEEIEVTVNLKYIQQ